MQSLPRGWWGFKRVSRTRSFVAGCTLSHYHRNTQQYEDEWMDKWRTGLSYLALWSEICCVFIWKWQIERVRESVTERERKRKADWSQSNSKGIFSQHRNCKLSLLIFEEKPLWFLLIPSFLILPTITCQIILTVRRRGPATQEANWIRCLRYGAAWHVCLL